MCGDSLASIFTEKSPSARNRWFHPHHSQSIKQRLAAFALTAIVSGLKFIGFVVVPVQFGSSLGFCFVCSPNLSGAYGKPENWEVKSDTVKVMIQILCLLYQDPSSFFFLSLDG